MAITYRGITAYISEFKRSYPKIYDALSSMDTAVLALVKIANALSTGDDQSSQINYFLYKQGTIAITSSVFPQIRILESSTVTEATLQLEIASIGSNVQGTIYIGSAKWSDFDIAAGNKTYSINVKNLPKTVKDSNFIVSLTQVGSTFPGSDLTLTIRTS